MTMYGELLRLAIDELEAHHVGLVGATRTAALEHDVAVLRGVLATASGRGASGTAGASGAIAAEVGYDASLVLLARSRGISCDPLTFSRPFECRSVLEAALEAQGVDVRGLEANGATVR